MSLINDALKKAQRERIEGPAGATTPPAASAGSPLPRRGRSQGGPNMMVLLGAGAVVLVVLSVVLTVYFVNRPSTPTATVASAATPAAKTPAAAPAATPPETKSTPSPASAATQSIATPQTPTPDTPKAAPTASAAATPAATSPITSAPAPASTPTTTTIAASTPAVSTPAPSPSPIPAPTAAAPTPSSRVVPTPAPPPAASPAAPAATSAATNDERIASYVDSIKVTGIRSSGNESRVLMNDRVYRVNDIVERNLGLRLIKVATDSLTFSDANGVTYVKHF